MKLSLAVLLFASFFSTSALAWDQASMNNQIEQTNFNVNDKCSGTLIDNIKGLVLTAKHCVDDQFETLTREVIKDDGTVKKEEYRRLKPGTVSQSYFNDDAELIRKIVYSTKLLAIDKTRDLALLKIKSTIPNTMAASLACRRPVRGDVAYTVGNPAGFYGTVTKGMVSNINQSYQGIAWPEQEKADQPLMQISSGVVGGNSGGAVYNDNGELIGVPVIAFKVNEILGFAVPIWEIKGFLKDNNVIYTSHCP